ncbi:60S ribosomal protein L37-3-like [Iris pallida]|uniref:60S ribosomal protein L37-3-like n=1 Tax=Iris pallida TaxID=29817 RepID=A0AAX6DGF4_IRIPA|nr:60S ribosomal protein L37-3-like [Iris pallida]
MWIEPRERIIFSIYGQSWGTVGPKDIQCSVHNSFERYAGHRKKNLKLANYPKYLSIIGNGIFNADEKNRGGAKGRKRIHLHKPTALF